MIIVSYRSNQASTSSNTSGSYASCKVDDIDSSSDRTSEMQDEKEKDEEKDDDDDDDSDDGTSESDSEGNSDDEDVDVVRDLDASNDSESQDSRVHQGSGPDTEPERPAVLNLSESKPRFNFIRDHIARYYLVSKSKKLVITEKRFFLQFTITGETK